MVFSIGYLRLSVVLLALAFCAGVILFGEAIHERD